MDTPTTDYAGHLAQAFAAIECAMERPSNVTHLAIHHVDDVDRAHVHREFEDAARAIEALPRAVRVFLRCELTDAHKAALIEAAGLLQAIGAKYAPQPKDAA